MKISIPTAITICGAQVASGKWLVVQPQDLYGCGWQSCCRL